MPDFSVIAQAPEIRALVQDGILERAFHDALFPRLLYRGEATPILWPANVGDRMIFTGTGLLPKAQRPIVPGNDPTPQSFTSEQWEAVAQQYASTIDTHMPTSMVAIANLFYRNAQQLGLQAGQSMNGIVRNKLYNTALAGHTVADGAQGPTNTIRVKRLNGFTRARRPDLAAGSPVRYDNVSASNPLPIKIFAGAELSRNVVAFAADTAGDEIGPGTITLDGAAISVVDRDYVISDKRTALVRVGGGNKIDSVGNTDLFRLADVRAAVAAMRSQNVPEHQDGYFHCHMDPTSEGQIFADAEFQRLLTSLPDYYMYKQFGIGVLLGTIFVRNTESPLPETVIGGDTAAFSQDDNFAGELFNTGLTTGMKVHRPLFVGQGQVMEYYLDLANLITEAGITGKVAEPKISNNGIDVFTERIQLIIRAPLNRLQDMVSTSWKFIGDWPVRTDGAVGGPAYFKRVVAVEHGE
jgi:hypothetical protein